MSRLADDIRLRTGVETAELVGKLTQWHVDRAFDMTRHKLVRLAHVDEDLLAWGELNGPPA